MKNNKITSLDPNQCLIRMYDEQHDANRVRLVGEHSFSLNSKEDSITSHSHSSEHKMVPMEPISCAGMKGVGLYFHGEDGVEVLVDVSPSDSDDVWFLESKLSNNYPKSQYDLIARRIRIRLEKETDKKFTVYLNLQGN